MLVLTIALGADRASLDFGRPAGSTAGTSQAQADSKVKVDLVGVQGTFDLAVDALGLLSGNVRVAPTGKWGLRVASLEAVVPNVATLTADGVVFNYDPAPPAGSGPQELLRIANAKIDFPSLGVTGSLRPYDPTAGRNVDAPTDGSALPAGVTPGLVIRDNGFSLGTAELAYGLGAGGQRARRQRADHVQRPDRQGHQPVRDPGAQGPPGRRPGPHRHLRHRGAHVHRHRLHRLRRRHAVPRTSRSAPRSATGSPPTTRTPTAAPTTRRSARS